MGAVLRSTCLLNPIKRKYPNSFITWITLPQCKPLLEGNLLVDRIVAVRPETIPLIEYLECDILFAVDKSLEAGAIAEKIRAKQKLGFGLTESGVIRPLNKEAQYQYDLGLDDNKKFYENEKPETQQITETMDLEWQRDPYLLDLSPAELGEVSKRREKILDTGKISDKKFKGIIGYNTGCSTLFPYKKFTIEKGIDTIDMWRRSFPDYAVVLLGGKEDHERQEAMLGAFSHDAGVFNSPCHEGLRSGILWMAAADIIFSGCSLGMHIAIALKKKIVAWFGVSCIQEIDLYDRGIKLQAEVSCSPCWKKSCGKAIKCYEQVTVPTIEQAFQRLIND